MMLAARSSAAAIAPLFVLFLFANASPSLVAADSALYSDGRQVGKEQPMPTLAARLTSRGVDFFGLIGHKLVNRELPNTKFPDISLPITSGPGTGQVDVTGMEIPARQFESPKFHFKLLPPNGIQFVSAGGLVPVNGQWSAHYKFAGITFSTGGWVQLVAQDIHSALSLGITHRKGRPQFRVFDCSAEVAQVEVQIGGGVIPWLVNLFRGALSSALRQAVHDQFCYSVKTTLLDQLNVMLVSLPDTYELGNSTLFLNYAFDDDIQVESTFVQSRAFANVLLQNGSACPLRPASPLSLPEPSRQWMFSAWLHRSVPNCLLWSAHQTHLLQMNIDPSFDGGKFAKFLQTNCHIYQICLGRFFPLLAHNYPDKHVDFHFHSASAPALQFVVEPSENSTSAAMNLEAQFYVDLHISPWRTNPEVLARLQMNATAEVEPRLDQGRLQGKLAGMEIKFAELSSSIGEFPEKFLNTFALLAKPVLRSVLQSALRVGFPLPTVDGIKMVPGSELSTFAEAQLLRVDTDLEYENATMWRRKEQDGNGKSPEKRRNAGNGGGQWQWRSVRREEGKASDWSWTDLVE